MSKRFQGAFGAAAALLAALAMAIAAEATSPTTPLGDEPLLQGGDLVDRLALPESLADNLRLSVDLASRANFHEARDAFFFQQFIGLDLHKVFSTDRGDLGTLTVQLYGTRIDNLDPPPPMFDDPHDWELVYRILNLNIVAAPEGRLNVRVGHFEIPFGLEHVINTNGTLRDYLHPRNLGLKADWGASINGTLPDLEYEIALTRGSGNEFVSKHDPYTVSGRIGTGRNRLLGGLSGYYAELPASGGTAERWRLALDGQFYEGAFGLLAEVGYGEDEDRGVSNNLVELDWVNPDETLTLFLQSRLFLEERATEWTEAVSLAGGARWTWGRYWAVSGQVAQDLEAFGNGRRNTLLSVQLRLRL